MHAPASQQVHTRRLSKEFVCDVPASGVEWVEQKHINDANSRASSVECSRAEAKELTGLDAHCELLARRSGVRGGVVDMASVAKVIMTLCMA